MAAPRAIVTDIEGTTTPIAFVRDVLFPFARSRMRAFLQAHRDDPAVAAALDDVARESGIARGATDALAGVLEQWISDDRKVTALKLLQGLIWDDGYASGALRGPVYPDAVTALRAWHAAGIALYVYSSGSVHAQKLLFGHSDHGDLRPLFRGYFDTTTGGKREREAYEAIIEQLRLPAADVLFLSDVPAELDAAAKTGLRTAWLVRPRDCDASAAERAASAHTSVTTFAEIQLG